MRGFDSFFNLPSTSSTESGVTYARVAGLRRDGDGQIVSAQLIERQPWVPHRPVRVLHWAAGIGSWEEL